MKDRTAAENQAGSLVFTGEPSTAVTIGEILELGLRAHWVHERAQVADLVVGFVRASGASVPAEGEGDV